MFLILYVLCMTRVLILFTTFPLPPIHTPKLLAFKPKKLNLWIMLLLIEIP